MPADAKEARYVELAGEVGRVIEQRVVHTFKVPEFLDMLHRTGGIYTGLLPFDCVLYKEGKYDRNSQRGMAGSVYRLFLVVRKPRIATIRFQGRDSGESKEDAKTRTVRSFPLAMPWVFTFLLFHNNGLARVGMYCSAENDPLSDLGLDARLYFLPLPNMNNGHFCLGELRLDSNQSFFQRVNRTMQFIDESIWNNDLWPIFGQSDGDSPSVRGIRDWSGKTESVGSAFWRKLLPRPTPYTINKYIGEVTT